MINTITNVYRIYCDFASETRPRYHPLFVKGVLIVAAWAIIRDKTFQSYQLTFEGVLMVAAWAFIIKISMNYQ